MDLMTLAEVLVLLGHLLAHARQKATWQRVTAKLEDAAGGGDVAVALRMSCALAVVPADPDTWHLKDGTYAAKQEIVDRLANFAPALKALDGGLTISGGESLDQPGFTGRILAGAKQLGLQTAIETSATSATA